MATIECKTGERDSKKFQVLKLSEREKKMKVSEKTNKMKKKTL